ncbi:MAG: serine/threonine-protein kinase [Amaricoccus sp.]
MIDPLPGDIFQKGQVINNTYEIEGVLGRGGTGEVYLARNQITGRVVAVKALNRAFSANEAYIELMKREEEMRNLSSDAVVRYTECSRSAEGHVYLVMDYVNGAALSELLERGGTPARDLMVVAHRVAEGLVATHAKNIVHRDLSPDNIILRGGDPSQAVIIDFGIAKDANAGARTIVGNDFAGKYEYAAPEQLNGKAEPRSDLYALGASLLATFRGQVPDVGGSPGEVVARKQRPLDTQGVPEPLRGLIDDLTQPDPARRPPSAAAVVAEIERQLKPSTKGPAGTVKAGGRRRVWPWVAVAAVLVLLAAGWFTGSRGSCRRAADGEPLRSDRRAGGGRDEPASRRRAERGGADGDRRGFRGGGGAALAADSVKLATGAPVDGWDAAVAGLIAAAKPLGEWRLDLKDRDASLSGVAPDTATRDAVTRNFTAAAASAGLTPSLRLAAGPARLDAAAVEAIVRPFEDCGPLSVAPPAGGSFPLGSSVAVAGNVADAATAEKLKGALSAGIGDRTARVDAAVLDPTLCGLVSLLPAVPAGPLSIGLGYGDRDGPNTTGTYAVGDNPVIDVLLPAQPDDGYLWVAIADVTGNLFNLLPNLGRPDAGVASNGVVEGETRRVRVAFGLTDAKDDPKTRPYFKVDDTFGKSLMIVFRTDRPLFDTLRPTTETVASFIQDLKPVLQAGQVRILALATQVIESGG